MATKQKTALRTLTVGAMAAALGVVLLCLSSVIPTARLSLAAVAGVLNCAVVFTGGIGAGFVSYGAAAALALLIAPGKGAAVLYVLFFGYYPMVKSLAERVGNRVPEWAIKLGTFNAALTVAVLFAEAILSEMLGESWAVWLVYAGGNVAFVVYDVAFSGIITLFGSKFGKFLRRER